MVDIGTIVFLYRLFRKTTMRHCFQELSEWLQYRHQQLEDLLGLKVPISIDSVPLWTWQRAPLARSRDFWGKFLDKIDCGMKYDVN